MLRLDNKNVEYIYKELFLVGQMYTYTFIFYAPLIKSRGI